MSTSQSLHVASYSSSGQLQGQTEVDLDGLSDDLVRHFTDKFQHLPGDLDLPLEQPIPGMDDSTVLRICSESSAAYVIYYRNDRPLLASLFLIGQDEEAEFEIMSTLKFLLLQGDDDDELNDDVIDSVLAAAEFDFEAVSDRPVTYQVVLDDDPEMAGRVQALKPIDSVVAAAFLAHHPK